LKKKTSHVTVFGFGACFYSFDWIYDAIAFDEYVLKAFIIGENGVFQQFSQCKNT